MTAAAVALFSLLFDQKKITFKYYLHTMNKVQSSINIELFYLLWCSRMIFFLFAWLFLWRVHGVCVLLFHSSHSMFCARIKRFHKRQSVYFNPMYDINIQFWNSLRGFFSLYFFSGWYIYNSFANYYMDTYYGLRWSSINFWLRGHFYLINNMDVKIVGSFFKISNDLWIIIFENFFMCNVAEKLGLSKQFILFTADKNIRDFAKIHWGPL